MILNLRLVGAVVYLNGPGNVFECESGIKRNKKKVCMLNLHFLKRQLHVFIIIVIIKVFAAVMHSKKINEANVVVQCFVLCKMADKRWEFKYLIQRCGIKYDDAQDDM